MVDISTALATIKAIAGVAREAGKIEVTQQVIDLQQTLVALLGENAELTSKNAELRDKLGELLEVLSLREALYYECNAYWRGEGGERDGPFCSRCFDTDRKAVRLTVNIKNVGKCGNCQNAVRLDGPISARSATNRQPRLPGWVDSWRKY